MLETMMGSIAYHPGEYISDDLQARGRTQKRLAELTLLRPNEINDLIKGRRSITPRLAQRIGAATGTGTEVWMNLQRKYDLYAIRSDKKEQEVLKAIKEKVNSLESDN